MFKKLTQLSLGILMGLLGGAVSFSQYIAIEGGDRTVHMFCPQTATIVFDKESNPNVPAGVILAMDFDPNEISFTANNFSFSSLFQGGGIAPSLVDGIAGTASRLFAQRAGINNILPSSGTVGSFSFASKRVLDSDFSFYYSGLGFTDVTSDTDLYYNVGEDMLVYASGAHIQFITGLCNPDAVGPAIDSFSPNITAHTRTVGNGPYSRTPAYQVSEKISSTSGLTFIVRDGDSYSKTQAGYISGTYPNLNLNDYRANTAGPHIYSPLNVADRASGIDPDSLVFKLSNTSTQFDKNNVANITPINGYTRDRRPRDYQIFISSGQINDYGIEVPISFSGYIKEYSNKSKQFSYTFNQAVNPWLTNLDPHHGQTQVLPRSDIKLRVRDDWAGINPNNIVVTVKHGATTLGVFSGNQLHLSAVSGVANSDDYNITILSGSTRSGQILSYPIPSALNTANTITVIVDVEDNKGNSPVNPHDRYSFDTRYSCVSYTGCQDPLTVFLYQSGSRNNQWFLDTEMYVTGAVGTGMPYVDSSGEILYCGDSNPLYLSGVNLIGSHIDNPQFYTGDILYFQGGNVIMSGNTIIFGDF